MCCRTWGLFFVPVRVKRSQGGRLAHSLCRAGMKADGRDAAPLEPFIIDAPGCLGSATESPHEGRKKTVARLPGAPLRASESCDTDNTAHETRLPQLDWERKVDAIPRSAISAFFFNERRQCDGGRRAVFPRISRQRYHDNGREGALCCVLCVCVGNCTVRWCTRLPERARPLPADDGSIIDQSAHPGVPLSVYIRPFRLALAPVNSDGY